MVPVVAAKKCGDDSKTDGFKRSRDNSGNSLVGAVDVASPKVVATQLAMKKLAAVAVETAAVVASGSSDGSCSDSS